MSALNKDEVWALYYRDGKSYAEIAALTGCTIEDLKGLSTPMRLVVDSMLQSHDAVAGTLRKIVAAQAAELAAERTIMSNQADMLDKLTERKRAQARAVKLVVSGPKIKRNPNYWASVKLGLVEGIWAAPARLLHALKQPVIAAVTTLAMIVVQLLIWGFTRAALVIAGLLGFVSEAEKQS